MRFIRSVVTTVFLLGLFIPNIGEAQPQELTPEQVAEAREQYNNAQSAMKAGDYDAAVAAYVAAYQVTGDAKMFFHIASAYEAAGKPKEAVVFYRRYLNEADLSDEGREEVRTKISELGANPGPVEPPPPPAATEEDPPPRSRAASCAGQHSSRRGEQWAATLFGRAALTVERNHGLGVFEHCSSKWNYRRSTDGGC